MSCKLMIVFWKDGEPFSLHEVTVPVFGEKGFYWSVCSYDSYHNRECGRLYDANLKGISDIDKRGSVKRFNEWKADRASWKKSVEKITKNKYQDPYHGLPYYFHDSIWDYYKAVGYDYKKKKYLKS